MRELGRWRSDVVQEPGGLTHLGDSGRQAWTREIDDCVADVTRDLGVAEPNPLVVHPADATTPHTTVVDWTGLPLRVVECAGRMAALELCDWAHTPGDGRLRPMQEEYVEWRVVGDEDGGIRCVEFTTELGAYWKVLAAHEPQLTLDLVAEFAGEERVDPAAVYRGCNPLTASPQERVDAFFAAMLSGEDPSAYNDGRTAITCMAQPTNTLEALVCLVLVAAQARVVRDVVSGRLRCATCEETIPGMAGAAQAGRASDPVLVERLTRLAYEGRLIAFDDPLGVTIQSVEHTRLRTRGGEPVPAEWFSFSRGLGPSEVPDGRPRWQRMTFEPPPDSGVRVSDLVDVATELPIRHGSQIAELVQVAVVLRVSDPDVVPAEHLDPTEPPQPDQHCSDVHEALATFRRVDRA